MQRRKKGTIRKKATLRIRDAAMVKALRTPVRQEVLGALERLGRASVREIAADLQMAPASLYYHVHELCRVGLAREAGSRPAGRRSSAVYEPAAGRIIIDRSVDSEEFVDALLDLHRAALRSAAREAAGALSPGRSGGTPPGESVSLLRLSARLRPADARMVRSRLRDMARLIEALDDDSAPDAFSFTATLVRLAPTEPRKHR
jgi:DNA-binding transcriptional ArsR family regulator